MASNFVPGKGRIATDLYDFHQHTDGYSLNHKASSIKVDVPGSVLGNANSVQDALVNLTNATQNINQTFVTVGDGYDTWRNANGVNNYDATVPSLDTLLNPIFSAITAGTALPTAYQRIKNGGIVFIKSGTYIVKNTIVVPPGITIMGEGFGTKIINATSLDFNFYPPRIKAVKTPGAVFRAQCDPNRGTTSDQQNSGSNQDFMFVRATKFLNMVIADNFVQDPSPTSGMTYYKLPQNIGVDQELNALIAVEYQSNVELNGIYLVGKTIFSAGTSPSSLTTFGVALTSMTNGAPTYNQTILKISNCFIDDVRTAGYFNGLYGFKDTVEIENSKIRGMCNASGNFTNNNVFTINDINLRMVNNSIIINNVFTTSCIIYYSANTQVAPVQKAQWIISGNNFSGTTSNSVIPLGINSTYGTTIYDNTSLQLKGNNLTIDNSIENIGFSGVGTKQVRIITDTTPYTIDSASNGLGSSFRDHIILYNVSTTGTKTLTIPTSAEVIGRNLTIKDVFGNARIYNIIITCSGSSTIDGSTTFTINQNFGSVNLLFYPIGGVPRWSIV